jgi:tripartite-type tricarboxylate transporter receptor subunit TctC
MPHRGFTRRELIELGAVAALGTSIPTSARSAAGCAGIAGRTVRWLVPYSAGGGFDVLSRLLQPFYEGRLDAQIVVTDMPGAGGLIATRALAASPPNGLTQGLISATSLLTAPMFGEDTPRPGEDFTLLGRIARDDDCLVTSSGSDLRTVDDLLAKGNDGPVIVATNSAWGSLFFAAAVTAWLLDVAVDFVTGYPGTREASLGLMRGEVDAMVTPFDSVLDRIESGDLRVILKLSDAPLAAHRSLDGVPLLGGSDGVATNRARALGRDSARAQATATTLVQVLAAGSVVAAPKSLPAPVAGCLADQLHAALTDPGFRAAAMQAKRSLGIATAEQARTIIAEATADIEALAPLLERAKARIRS